MIRPLSGDIHNTYTIDPSGGFILNYNDVIGRESYYGRPCSHPNWKHGCDYGKSRKIVSAVMSIFNRSHAPALGRVYCNTDIRLQVIPVTDPGKRHWKRTLDSQASPSSLSYNQPSHQLPTHLRLLPLQNVSIPLLSLTRAK